MKKLRLSLFIIAATLVSYKIFATTSQELDSQLQGTLNHYLATTGKIEKSTAGSVTVYMPGSDDNYIIRNYVAGKMGYPPQLKSVKKGDLFQIGSITKSFTAAMILQLQAEGKLSLQDKLGKCLPEYSQWKDITIEQLLNMTSGIPSYTKNPAFIDRIYAKNDTHYPFEALIQYAEPNKPIKKSDIGKFDYSNTNYVLAGKIIELAGHDSYANQLKKRILDPLHLYNTFYITGLDWKEKMAALKPRLVHGYYQDENTHKMVDITEGNLSWAGPAGGIISTTDDIAHWVVALFDGRIFPEASRQTQLKALKKMTSVTDKQTLLKLNPKNPAGFGLGVSAFYLPKAGGTFWAYEGSGQGYRMQFIYKPCNHIVIVAALNSKAGEGSGEGDQIKALSLQLYNDVMKLYPKLNCLE